MTDVGISTRTLETPFLLNPKWITHALEQILRYFLLRAGKGPYRSRSLVARQIFASAFLSAEIAKLYLSRCHNAKIPVYASSLTVPILSSF